MSDTQKGTRAVTTSNTPLNAISFLVEMLMRGGINTAMPVRVDRVEPGGIGPVGWLAATPLVCQRDGYDNSLAPQPIPRLPYFRLQGGVAAVIVDPMPGDIGIAIFAQQDISGVSTGLQNPVPPGSYRAFDMADGIYIGGIQNREPEIWLELTQEHVATLHAPMKVVVETTEAIINASASCTVNTEYCEVNAPISRFNGSVEVRDNLSWGQEGMGLGGSRARITHGLDVNAALAVSGGITNTSGTMSSNGIVLDSHVHPGVEPGGGTTGGPA